MESTCLSMEIDSFGLCGVILNPEQKAALQISLVILKEESKHEKVYFWGKISGLKDDYYIAQGSGKDEFAKRKTYYCKDFVHWVSLPDATEDMRNQAQLATGRFTGDPSYEFEHVEMKKTGEGDEVTEEEETVTIKEEDRLASVIAEIDQDVRIVPRSSFVRRPTGSVVANRSFEGLTTSEAAKLCNYLHFREPMQLEQKSLLQKANLDKAIDFMDSAEEDIPKGSWSMQFERGSRLCVLRSLLWQGYFFIHCPGTRQYGSVYWGTGERNMDLPIML